MTWQPGSDRVTGLLAAGELEQVTPAADVARTGAYQLAYDAFRKSAQVSSPPRDYGLPAAAGTWPSRKRSSPSSAPPCASSVPSAGSAVPVTASNTPAPAHLAQLPMTSPTPSRLPPRPATPPSPSSTKASSQPGNSHCVIT